MSEDLILIGKVIKPHGVKGELRIEYFNPEEPSFFSNYREILLRDERGVLRPFRLLKVRPHKRFLLVKLEGLRSREEASRWKGGEVLVRRDELPPLGEDEYYWQDILGMEVFSKEGKYLGEVKEILRTGSNDVYVVRKDRKEMLLPALKEVILEVDCKEGRMVVNLIEGLT